MLTMLPVGCLLSRMYLHTDFFSFSLLLSRSLWLRLPDFMRYTHSCMQQNQRRDCQNGGEENKQMNFKIHNNDRVSVRDKHRILGKFFLTTKSFYLHFVCWFSGFFSVNNHRWFTFVWWFTSCSSQRNINDFFSTKLLEKRTFLY